MNRYRFAPLFYPIVLAALVLSSPAKAECLGSGCYSGLGAFLIGFVGLAIAVLAAFIFLLVRVYRRKGGKSAVFFAMITLVGGYLFLALWGGYWL